VYWEFRVVWIVNTGSIVGLVYFKVASGGLEFCCVTLVNTIPFLNLAGVPTPKDIAMF
jgi:hypothetical protein